MVIRAALQSALSGMTAAHHQLAATAGDLARPLANWPNAVASASSDQAAATQSMSAEIGSSLIALHESLTLARLSSATADTAQSMLDELLQIARR